MITPSKRKKRIQAEAKVARERRKEAKKPLMIEVDSQLGVLLVPAMRSYADILNRAYERNILPPLEDTRLLDIANEYELPLTQEQATLVQTGDTFLPQYNKIDIPEEEQVELMMDNWSPVRSSNIKAVKIEGDDLLIAFHSGDKYRYPGDASMYYPFNEALSPGRLLWRTIRPFGVKQPNGL